MRPKNSCPTGRDQGTQKTFKNINRRLDGERSSKKRASIKREDTKHQKKFEL